MLLSKMKTCTICKKEKEVDAFYHDKHGKYGYRAKCKECEKAYSKGYFQKNRKRHLEQMSAYKRSGGPTRFATLLLQNARMRSLRKQRECTLTADEIMGLRERQGNLCAYLGTLMVWRPNSGIFQVSLDRIDSSKGYIISNCQLVCDGINQLKSDMKEEDFVYLLKMLARPVLDNLPPFVPYSGFTNAQKNKFSNLYWHMKGVHRKVSRNVTREELHGLRENFQDRCALTGIRVTWETNQWTTASWDRIDSSGDYEADNMQLTIWPVNRMKKNHPNEEAKKMIQRIREVYGEEAFDL